MWLGIICIVRFMRSFFDGHANYRLTQLGVDLGNTMTLGMVKKSLKYYEADQQFGDQDLTIALALKIFR